MEKTWSFKDSAEPRLVEELSSKLKVGEVVAELLVQRGIVTYDDAKTFFRPMLEHLHDPFMMKDMDRAIDRIEEALANDEKILVYGDYDVDGTTSVSLMYSFLRDMPDLFDYHGEIDYYIPDRYREGYGVSLEGIDYAKEGGVSLIIALDCGIKAIDQVEYAKQKGIDFIICDHHRPGEKLPEAIVLDPKREDCPYPYKELSGCGIGFKVAQAFLCRHEDCGVLLYPLMDLVAVSIAADIVPITGENRTLCAYGLQRINKSPRPGFRAMLHSANKLGEASVTDLVFVIGPRINAAGRIDHATRAVQLLIAEDMRVIKDMSKKIDGLNKERKDLDRSITKEALEMIRSDEKLVSAKSTVVYNKDWHKGVVGIVASRLTENYYRPTIVLTRSNGKVTGSARSVKGYDVYNAIDACSELLEQFGGHKYAAGLTMREENIADFRDKFEEVVSSTIRDEHLKPTLLIDKEIELEEINPDHESDIPKFVRVLRQFAPFGPGNMRPTFMARNLSARGECRVVGEDHLKMKAHQAGNRAHQYDAIAFGLADFEEELDEGKLFDAVFTVEENEWRGKVSVQLVIKDIKMRD